MSGGVGPSKDIALPKDEPGLLEPEVEEELPTPRPGGKPWFLRLRHVNALVLAIVLAASGTVSAWDLAFVALAAIYMFFLSRVAFPARRTGPEPLAFDPNSQGLRMYIQLGALVGLYLPVAYILEGFYSGDREGIEAAAPHLFLLAAQIFMEGVAFSGGFSGPVRAFVPVFYNSRRISSIMEWLGHELGKADGGGALSRRRRGLGLAAANMAFWSYNLFGFLLPVYLPKVFKGYYSSTSPSASDNKVKKIE